MIYSYGEQEPLPDDAQGSLWAEQDIYVQKSEAAADWLDSLPDAAAARMWVLEVRCPAKGCLVGQVYRLPLRNSGERFLFLGVTSVGVRRARFLNWAFSDDWHGPPVWFPVGCRHGHGKLERAWLLDAVGLVWGWHHQWETLEQARAKARKDMQRAIARKVFHPKPECWDPK